MDRAVMHFAQNNIFNIHLFIFITAQDEEERRRRDEMRQEAMIYFCFCPCCSYCCCIWSFWIIDSTVAAAAMREFVSVIVITYLQRVTTAAGAIWPDDSLMICFYCRCFSSFNLCRSSSSSFRCAPILFPSSFFFPSSTFKQSFNVQSVRSKAVLTIPLKSHITPMLSISC